MNTILAKKILLTGIIITSIGATPYSKAVTIESTIDTENISDYTQEGDYTLSNQDWDDYNDGFIDPIFGELNDKERKQVEEEFNRHYDSIDPLYEDYFTTDKQEIKEKIKKQMQFEIEKHYTNLLTFVRTSQGKDALQAEKNMYIDSLQYLDEMWEENDLDDLYREENIFEKNVDGATLDAIFEKYNEQIEKLFLQMENNMMNKKDSTGEKEKLTTIITAIYKELIPYATTQGKEILKQEKENFIDYIENFESYVIDEENEYYIDETQDNEGIYYAQLKELSEQEYEALEDLWQKHDETMDNFYQQLENNPTQKVAIQTKMIDEINSMYKAFAPYITEDTLQYLEQEKNDYIKFIQEEITNL